MEPSTGVLPTRKSLSAIEAFAVNRIGGFALLLVLGAFFALLRRYSHQHLHLPGHHALIELAILIGFRRAMPYPWSATIIGVGASGTALVSGLGSDALTPLYLLLAGPVIDVAFLAIPKSERRVFVFTLVGLIANGLKPVIGWSIVGLARIHVGSLAHGLAYPVATHIAFGACGGLLGAFLLRWHASRTKAL